MDHPPDLSVIVGVKRLAEMTGRSQWWAKKQLEAWLEEQMKGGPQRVFVRNHGRRLLFTTLGVIQRDIAGLRDPVLVRKLKEHEKDLTQLARRIDALSTEVVMLRKILGSRRAS